MLTQIIHSDCGCEFEIGPGYQQFRWCSLHKAAPDMYEALKAAFEDYTGGRCVGLSLLGIKMEQALAKAEGK